jgi:hypothetical protein
VLKCVRQTFVQATMRGSAVLRLRLDDRIHLCDLALEMWSRAEMRTIPCLPRSILSMQTGKLGACSSGSAHEFVSDKSRNSSSAFL